MQVQPVDPAGMLGRAVDALAVEVARQWRAELSARGLGHLDPSAVRWATTSRPVGVPPEEIVGGDRLPPSPVRVTRLRLSGRVEDMARMLANSPARQVAIIGSPGSGKSTLAMLLTLGLLARRQPGDPLPVLVTVSSWDPGREHLDTWLVRRLVELYPALGARGGYGPDAAMWLVDRGLVVPVLDGLDEMAGPAQAPAITALTAAVGRDRPLVVTCRADEYQRAVAQAGSPLARAAVVEIEPVSAADAAAYLPEGQLDGAARWRPVLAHLAAEPDGGLAHVFRTPLMVYLARTAYRAPGSNPAELLTFTEPGNVELHLEDKTIRIWVPHRAFTAT
ncbi:NACHT domain-containing protein [Dactylosporangium cerinum]|uniref:NACHT domain-containing protein n=1 Tax=Dactylosporangium cerinum TaxID=1434730 RepID=A0ABV9W4J5_9ACTN